MPENHIFEANELYLEQFNWNMSEAAFYKALERLVKEHTLIKLSKGLYARPEKSKYGIISPSEEEIVVNYTRNNKGIVIGYQLYNYLNISTQVSKNIKIYCNKINQHTKTVGNIYIERREVEFSEEVCRVVEMLEILNYFNRIEDLNYNSFISLCEKFYNNYNEETTKYVLSKMHYSKRAIAFLQNILNNYGVENSLGENLSAFSTYSYPSMEEIYALARK